MCTKKKRIYFLFIFSGYISRDYLYVCIYRVIKIRGTMLYYFEY